jgi:hypothetical protein
MLQRDQRYNDTALQCDPFYKAEARIVAKMRMKIDSC